LIFESGFALENVVVIKIMLAATIVVHNTDIGKSWVNVKMSAAYTAKSLELQQVPAHEVVCDSCSINSCSDDDSDEYFEDDLIPDDCSDVSSAENYLDDDINLPDSFRKKLNSYPSVRPHPQTAVPSVTSAFTGEQDSNTSQPGSNLNFNQHYYSTTHLPKKRLSVGKNKNIICFNVCTVYCCNLSVDVALNVRFTMNGMCVKNNTHMYVVRTSNNRVISLGDLYCCLLPQCEALRTCCSGFPIATKWCCDQDVKVVPSAAFTKRTWDLFDLL